MSLKNFYVVFAVIAILMINGCASIVGGGSTQSINIDSNPQGAKIFVGEMKDGKLANLVDSGLKTPSFITIKRKNTVIVLKHPGYTDIEVPLTTSMNGWFMGNFCIGGLLGSSIDSSTGAINKYDPGNYFVEMKSGQ
ncbi:MAG TPA: PEGA domain-containing protein [Gammaproteobacteria bacterium]